MAIGLRQNEPDSEKQRAFAAPRSPSGSAGLFSRLVGVPITSPDFAVERQLIRSSLRAVRIPPVTVFSAIAITLGRVSNPEYLASVDEIPNFSPT
jgi:hypothetical protein